MIPGNIIHCLCRQNKLITWYACFSCNWHYTTLPSTSSFHGNILKYCDTFMIQFVGAKSVPEERELIGAKFVIMALESKEELSAPHNHVPSPPLIPIIGDDGDDIKTVVEDWCEAKDVEPMTINPDSSHSSIIQAIAPPFQPSKRNTESLLKDLKFSTIPTRGNQKIEMAEDETFSAELKRKLSMESVGLQGREIKVKEKRCCPSLSPPPSEIGDVLWEKEQGARIGEGTYGRVFRKAGQAIKTALNSLESKTSLEREAKILESLSHPNIVEFYAFKEHKLYMELADSTLAHKSGCPDIRIVAKELFTALNYLHSRGIIHGDLKPANLLQKNGSLRLCDFGQSKYEHESYTPTGTTTYVAPECLQLLPTQTFKSDIYSAGACLYYLMTGRDPFQQHTNRNAVQMIIRIRAGFFGTDNVQVDHENPLKHSDTLLVDVVKRCTSKEARRRPDAKEVLGLLTSGIK